jgi:Na+/proline symporter/nitrogen-specific signal transduction histidine kinase
MNISVFAIVSFSYILLLFLIAFYTDKRTEKGAQWTNNPYIYSLSLAVYCTAWTFFGSVGKASKSGLGMLPIYFGPTLLAPLWIMVLRKIILISKSQRITSIADFISSRYGKSSILGVSVTVVAFFGIIPYISLQLKAIADSFDLLATFSPAHAALNTEGVSFFYSTVFYIAAVLAIFTILFGTRNIDPNERHEGLVTAVAFESIVKLVAFLAVGFFVTFGLYNGFSDLFHQAALNPKTYKLLFLSEGSTSPSEWFWLTILSMSAFMFLPRQFHISVVENINPQHVNKAMWLLPLYLLIINIFVLPVTLAGLMQFEGMNIRPDNFVLQLPLANGQYFLGLLVFIGGLSAATSMVIVETTALSIMISNHIVIPFLINNFSTFRQGKRDISKSVILVRRISIVLIMLLALAYVRTIASNRELVSIGLVSFAAVTQFAPIVIGGLFWKRATRLGALAGLSFGFMVWAMTLTIPTMAEYGLVSKSVITEGYWGLSFLKPYALFGLEGYDQISHSAFWSLFFNISAYVLVSLYTKQSSEEITQADYFVNIYKYMNVGNEFEVLRRQAKMEDLRYLMNRFLGEERANILLRIYEEENEISLDKTIIAQAEIVAYVETQLAGALGASSAKVLVGSVVKEDPISLDEMLRVLDQTQEIIVTNRELERKSKELQEMAEQLQNANNQLKQLDTLKADFVTTVTHELRTPMTSIKALSKILLDNKDLPKEQHDEFLNIVVLETERITRLINQVLDIERLQSNAYNWKMNRENLNDLIARAGKGIKPICIEKGIDCELIMPDFDIFVIADNDRITQVIVNLLSNAVKFTNTEVFNPENSEGGYVGLELSREDDKAIIRVKDNGKGIAPDKQAMVFERFTQIDDPSAGKPTGSGLGLFISRRIIEHHKGRLYVESVPNEGATFIIELPIG